MKINLSIEIDSIEATRKQLEDIADYIGTNLADGEIVSTAIQQWLNDNKKFKGDIHFLIVQK